MADFLIMAINKTNPDLIKDARGCYKRGDIVEVFGHGKLQVPHVGSPFVLVRVSGVTKAQADKYMVPEEETLIGPKLIPEIYVVRRRRYHIDWTLLPVGVIKQLWDNRFYETTLSQVRNYIRNKGTGVLG